MEVRLLLVHLGSRDQELGRPRGSPVPHTCRSECLHLLDIGRGAFAAVSGGWLILGCTVDHIGEFFVRAIEEGAQLGDTLLVLESATAGDHEKAGDFRGLSAQGEEFIGDAPTTARAEAEKTETASKRTAWSAPAVTMMMSVSMTERAMWAPASAWTRSFTLHPGRSPAFPVGLLRL